MFDARVHRYIANYNRAHSIGVMLRCQVTPVHDAHEMFEEVSTQNSVLLEPLPVVVVNVGPWPPPTQLCSIWHSENFQPASVFGSHLIVIWLLYSKDHHGLQPYS